MSKTRMTVGQAIVKFLNQQYIEMDGKEEPFVDGMFTIFGHGMVVGLGQALEEDPGHLRVYQGRNEQGMAHAAISYAKQHNRRKIIACTSSIGVGAANMVTAALTATINNIPLLLFGLKRQGAVFSIYAIFTVCVYSVAAWLITDVLPIDVSIASPLAGTDLFLCALFGGIISGVGSGLAIRYGGAMDGIEVVAVIFAKPLGLSVGTFVLIYNVLLYMICGIVMGSWILPLYSIVTYAAGSKTVDFIVDGLDSAKAAMIITTHPDEIARAVSEEFGTGLTIIDAHGFYSDTPKTVLYVVVNRFQTVKLKTLVKGVDANAYMAISPVADLLHGSKEEETA